MIAKKEIDHLRYLTEKLNNMERKVEKVNNLFRAMCDNLPMLIWCKDLDEKYIFANKMCCEQLLNTNAEEVVGKSDMYFADRERAANPEIDPYHTLGETCRESDQQVLRNKEVLRKIENGYIKGKPVSIKVYKAPFLDKDNEMIGVVGCAEILK
jgi:PAS domain-containing protein